MRIKNVYSQIARVKIYPEEFEKTPKKSIKRFLRFSRFRAFHHFSCFVTDKAFVCRTDF